MMPREGYKSTIVQGKIIKEILKFPDVKILYGMKDVDKLEEKLDGIRNQLEGPAITQIFGEQKGKPWKAMRFNVAGRTEAMRGAMERTVNGFSLKKFPTGGHYHFIFLDDLVDWDNVHTAEGMDLVMRCWKMVQPLLLSGGMLIVIGTPYAEADLYWMIKQKLGRLFKVLELPPGVSVETKDNGQLEVVGKSIYAHLDVKRLNKKLIGMLYPNFCSQYLLKIVAGIHQPFRRTDFLTVKWDHHRMSNWTGYILTDTATTDRKTNSYGVVCYVLISPSGDPYIADIRLGHFTPTQYVSEFFSVFLRWQNRCNHAGEAMEVNVANNVFRVNLEQEADRIGIRLNLILITRGGRNEASKDERISRLQPDFANGQIFWLDTIPKLYVDVAEQLVLYDPYGYRDPDTGIPLPEGELVTSFTSWPTWPNKDLPDALADLKAIDKFGRPLIKFVHPSVRRRRRAPRRGERVLQHLTRGYDGSHDHSVIPVEDLFREGGAPKEDYFGRKHSEKFGG